MDWLKDWGMRFWADFLEVLSGRPALALIDKIASWFNALWLGLSYNSIVALWDEFTRTVPEIYRDNVADLATFLAWELQVITGLPIDRAKILAAISPTPGAIDQIALGKVLGDPFFLIFNVPEVARGYKDRLRGTGELRNLMRFIGANTRLQVGGMAVNTLSSVLPFNLPNAFKDIPEKVDNILGWQDLMEEIIQSPIQALCSEGLLAKFYRETKPVDYTFAEAMKGYHAGMIPRDIVSKVMDNLGYRDDTRTVLIDLNEADLSDADLVELYEHRRLTKEDIVKEYRGKGYGARKADLKAQRAVNNRTWSYLDKIADQYLNLFRDCVMPQQEVEVLLTNLGWTQGEVNAAIALKSLEQRQRKWLSESKLDKAVDTGIMTTSEVFDYLTCQGMTPIDATIDIIQMLTNRLPKDCFDKIVPIDLDKAFQLLLQLLQTGDILALPFNLIKFLKCLGITEFPELPDEEDKDKKPALKLPTGAFNAIPSSPDVGEQFRLVWNIQNADTVVIDNGIGPQPSQGVLFLIAAVNTIWKLLATNKDGARTFQASLLAKRLPPPKVKKEPFPTLSLRISPTSLLEGDQYGIEWETRFATEVFLEDGGGQIPVALSGAQFRTADHSRIFTLTAAGPGGQRSRSETQVVRPEVLEAIKPPSASLSVSPGRATTGDRVEVKWSTSNATVVTLTGANGPETVASAGVRIITADHDRIFSLSAASPSRIRDRVAWDALIVDPPEAEEPPTVPKPTANFVIRPARTLPGETVALELRTTNSTTVTLQRGNIAVPVDREGAMTIVTEATETMILRATGPGGTTAVVKILVVVPKEVEELLLAPPTVSLTVRPSQVVRGDLVALEWRVTRATRAELTLPTGTDFVDLVGAKTITATETTNIILLAEGPGGKSSAVKILVVEEQPPVDEAQPKPTARLTVSPSRVMVGQVVALEWRTANATKVTLIRPSGTLEVNPVSATTMIADRTQNIILRAEGPGGEATDVQVLVVLPLPIIIPPPEPEPPVPTSTFSVSPRRAKQGKLILIDWRTENATDISLQRPLERITLAPQGSMSIVADQTELLVLDAQGPGGREERSKLLLVTPPAVVEPPPTPEPPDPRVTLALRPAKAKPGEIIIIEWHVTNATEIFVGTLAGERQEVADGFFSYTVQTTEMITVRAVGPGGEVKKSKVLVAST